MSPYQYQTVAGISVLASYSLVVNYYVQFYIIQLTSFQTGVDATGSFLALTAATVLFQTHLIDKNWRLTEYFSKITSASIRLLWILVYFNTAGLQNAWFSIFIDIDAVNELNI